MPDRSRSGIWTHVTRLYNAQALTNPSSPLILYLPPTGSHLRDQHSQIPSYLFHPSTSVARINYRWNIPTPPPIQFLGSSPSPKLLTTSLSYATHPFPTPLHDTLHAYSHLVDTILPQYAPPEQPPTLPPSPYSSPRSSYSPSPAFSRLRIIQRPILIYGSFLSGPLATSLALTESRTSRSHPVRIAGLIARNGIFDFSPLALMLPRPSTSSTPTEGSERDEKDIYNQTGNGYEAKPGNQGWDNPLLHSLKKTLFASPETTFDSFASPVLFFRTPGAHIPKTWPGENHPPSSSESENLGSIWLDGFEGFDQHGEPILSPINEKKEDENESENVKKKQLDSLPAPRKSYLKYPPTHTDLVIPPTLFLYSSSPTSSTQPSSQPSSQDPMLKKTLRQLGLGGLNPQAQATEMRHLMTRSIVMHELKERSLWDEELGDPREVAEGRVEMVELEGGDGGNEGNEEEEVRRWIGDVLGRGSHPHASIPSNKQASRQAGKR